jgi:hypothetical protein
MGAWGYKNFENDTALDWLSDFTENSNISEIQNIFNYILEQEEFLDSDESFIGLACAEIILNQLDSNYKGNIPPNYDIEKITLNVTIDLIQSAMQVIEKILYFNEHSELRELWKESEDYENWRKEQRCLFESLRKYL